jgi:hypothetical protein
MPWNAVLTVPMVGEFSDVIWAPIAAYLMTRMYRNGRKVGEWHFLKKYFLYRFPFTLMYTIIL